MARQEATTESSHVRQEIADLAERTEALRRYL
jgi:hypothetical protein